MDFDINYPTQDDADYFRDKAPKLKQFGFRSFSNYDHFKPFNEIARAENLNAWDNVVLNTKIYHLKKSYLNCLTFHKRGLSNEVKNLDDNTKNFIFYLENAFYTIQSIDDVFLQIVNVFYDICLEENEVSFRTNPDGKPSNKFSKELNVKYPEVFDHLKSHISSVKEEKDVRHSSVHRYPLLFIDRKTKVEFIDGKESISLSSFNNDMPDYKNLLDLLESWINKTEILQENLRRIFFKSETKEG